jgi:protein-S-isoprenylcysteine O-methyltransferase Ste14
MAGIREFRVARTTVNPLQPGQATSMVTSGIYRFTRNPMYLGMMLLLVAWSAWLGNALALLLAALFVLYIGRFQIAPEERMLSRLFGPDFDAYRGQVRRWL